MDKKLKDIVNQRVDQYLAEVAEQNPFNLPTALMRVSLMCMTLILLDSFISDFDDSLKHLEDELRALLRKGKS